MAIFQSFDPTSMRKEDLREIFVAREKLLEYILKRVNESGKGKSKKHLLIVGPRGSGKTHLQLLVYYSIQEKHSKKWLAIKFPEEQYSITSMADLLLEILREMGQEDIKEAAELHSTLLPMKEDVIEEQAAKFLKEYHQRSNRNLLLLLENFQEFAQQMETEGMQSLRAYIQENDFIMLLPSALSVFQEVVDHKEPFYGFFEVIPLDEISLNKTEKLLFKLAKWEKKEDLAKKLKTERERIKGIYNLTGGSVRLIVLIYHIISHEALSEVEDALHNLLNELTPYYQYQMMALSPQQRKIIDSMALYSEGRIQPTELAKRTKIDPRVISNQLKILKNLGYVKSFHKGRTARYEVTERLFRIWREIRLLKGKSARLTFLLEFFKYYYQPIEIWELYKKWEQKFQSCSNLEDKHPELINAQKNYEYLFALVESEDIKAELRIVHVKQAVEMMKENRNKEAIEVLNKYLEIDANDILALYLKGGLLYALNQPELALETLEESIKIKPIDGLSWAFKGLTLVLLNLYDEAFAAFEKSNEMNPNNKDLLALQDKVLISLPANEEVLIAAEKSAKLNPNNALAWAVKGMVLGYMEHYQEGLAVVEKSISLNSKQTEAWRIKGEILGGLKRYEEALAASEKSLEINLNSAESWKLKGKSLYFLERYEEAIAALEKSIELNPSYVETRSFKGRALGELRRYEEALVAYEEGLLLNSEVATCWLQKGKTLISLKRYEEALVAYERNIELTPNSLNAWIRKGALLVELKRFEEALTSFDRAYQIDPKVEPLATTLFGFSVISLVANNQDIAYRSFEKAIHILFEFSEESQRENLVMYFSELFKLKRIDFIEKTLEQTIENFPKIKEILKPYEQALKYLKTSDDEWLNNLHPEEREVVKDILGLRDDAE